MGATWSDPPACESMSELFTEKWEQHRRLVARTCEECPVLRVCAIYCLENDVEGFAAGMTPHQRNRIRAPRVNVTTERGQCETCLREIDGHGNRRYCSEQCRDRMNNRKYRDRQKVSAA